MRITTNIDRLERVAPPEMEIVAFSASRIPGTWQRNMALLRSALRSQHLVIHFAVSDIIFFSFFLFIIPGHRCRITTLDFFAGEVKPWQQVLVRWSLGRVSRFLVYFRDTRIFEELLGIPAAKFHYVPFKINGYHLICAAESRDEGYIFCGGRSRRDFATFLSVVEELGYPVKLLTAPEHDLTPHGSSLKGLSIPDNVEMMFNDSDIKHFVQTLTGARLVVVPLHRDSRTQTGIGMYLQGMAARKCVIVSSCLGVSDVLSGTEAIIVPAGDRPALKAAIEQAWTDAGMRQRYADSGASYALALGDDDQLRKSVLNALPD